jgi:hypothetical protein
LLPSFKRTPIAIATLLALACGGSSSTPSGAPAAPAAPAKNAATVDAGGSAGDSPSPSSSPSGSGGGPGSDDAGSAEDGGAVDRTDASALDADGSAALATGIFPPVTDPGQTGPFKVTAQMSTGPGNNYALYYPTSIATDGYKHPSLVWGNGALASPSNYTTLLTTVASNGFVIVEYNGTPNAQQMTDAIDWLVAQNAAQGSVLDGHLDASKIAAGGHSAGSIAAFDAAADPRLSTTVHLSGGTMSPHTDLANLRHPALFVCGDTPTGAGLTTGDVANPNCEYDFENATVPVFYGMLKGASHLSTYDGIGDDTQRTAFARAIIGWLRWKLAADQTLAAMFVGTACTLCSDPAWVAKERGL